MDIHKGRANANKIMNRVLTTAAKNFDIKVCEIDGGSLRNAIPRESAANILVPNAKFAEFENWLVQFQHTAQEEYRTTDADLKIEWNNVEPATKALLPGFQKLLLACLYTCPNGIYRMSPEIDGLVQTSNNLARVLVKNGNATIMCLTRSSVDSEKMDLAQAIENCFSLCGAEVIFGGSYPGWSPDPHSGIVRIMRSLYIQKFGAEPNINACHAGLECGIIGANYPGMEMISFGPNIRGAHSPDECVQVSSVQKFWDYLLDVLRNIE
jgi:dipeptidase D